MNRQLIEAYRRLAVSLIIENKQLFEIADKAIVRGSSSEEDVKMFISIKEKKSNPKHNKKWEN